MIKNPEESTSDFFNFSFMCEITVPLLYIPVIISNSDFNSISLEYFLININTTIIKNIKEIDDIKNCNPICTNSPNKCESKTIPPSRRSILILVKK